MASNNTYNLTGGLNSVVGSVIGSLTNGMFGDSKPEPDSMIKDGKMTNVKGGKEIIHKAKDGKAQVFLAKDYANIASGDNGLEVSADGCLIGGATDFSASPHQIRIGGFWVLNEELLTTLPSTLFNPVQTLLYKDPPTAKRASKIIKAIATAA